MPWRILGLLVGNFIVASSYSFVIGRLSFAAIEFQFFVNFTFLRKIKMSAFTESALTTKLLALNSSQQSIQTLSLWLIHHRKHSQIIVKNWYRQLQKGMKLISRRTIWMIRHKTK